MVYMILALLLYLNQLPVIESHPLSILVPRKMLVAKLNLNSPLFQLIERQSLLISTTLASSSIGLVIARNLSG